MASFAEPARAYWIAHGTLMILAWGFFIPIGTLLAVYRRYVGKNGKILKKEPSFYPWHRNFQWFGFILAMIAFGMGAAGSRRVYNTGRPFSNALLNFESDEIPWNRHVKWGVSVLIMAGTQVLLGIIAHILKDRHMAKEDAGPWKRPIVPSWLHLILGVACMLSAYVTIFQGLQLFDYIFYYRLSLETSPGIKAGYALVSVSGFLFLTAYMYEKASMVFCPGSPPEEKEELKDEKPEMPKAEDEEVPKTEEVLAPEGAA